MTHVTRAWAFLESLSEAGMGEPVPSKSTLQHTFFFQTNRPNVKRDHLLLSNGPALRP